MEGCLIAVRLLLLLLMGLPPSGIGGNVHEMTGTYFCKEGNISKLKINTTWIPLPCTETSMSVDNRMVYSEEEGFVSPILDHPTDDEFLVEECPEIVYKCNYDGQEARITYTGVKVNTTYPRFTAVTYIVPLIIVVLSIGVACYVIWKIFRSKKTPLSVNNSSLMGIDDTEYVTVHLPTSLSSQPDSTPMEN